MRPIGDAQPAQGELTEGTRMVRRPGQFVARHRPLGVPERPERLTSIVEDVGVVRSGGKDRVIAIHCLIVAPKHPKQIGAIVHNAGLIGSEGKRLIESRKGVLGTAEQEKSAAKVIES